MSTLEATPVSSWRPPESSPESTVSPDPSVRSTAKVVHRISAPQNWDSSRLSQKGPVLTSTTSPNDTLYSDGHEPSKIYTYAVKARKRCKKSLRLLTVLGIVAVSFACIGLLVTYSPNRLRLPQTDEKVSALLDDGSEASGARGLRSRVRLFDWSPETEREVKRHRIKVLHILFYEPTAANASVVEEAMRDVASTFYKQNILHVRVRRELMRDFQFFLPEDPELYVPFSTIVEVDHGFRKYRCPETPTSSIAFPSKGHAQNVNVVRSQLSNFEQQYFDDKLSEKVWLRSDKAYGRDEQDESNVKQLVGSEFQASVIKANIDALVFFYAPWCGHCKRFEKSFTELADSFSQVPTLKFFKLDVTKNDVDHNAIIIHRVPYVRLFKRHDKINPVVFEHAHTSLDEYGKNFLLQNIVTDGVGIEL